MLKKRNQILLVDDAVEMVKILQVLLEANGYRVETAHNGLEALEKLAAGSHPDLIILDMDMPKMGGIAFYHEICRLHDGSPKFPVLVFTGREQLEGLFKELKVEGFVKKPFEIDALQKQIDDVFTRLYGDSSENETSPKAKADRRVLVVDEDRANLDSIVLAFMNDGYEVFNGLTGSGRITFESDKTLGFLIRKKRPAAVLMKIKTFNPLSREIQTAARLVDAAAECGAQIILYGANGFVYDAGMASQITNEASHVKILAALEVTGLLKEVNALLS